MAKRALRVGHALLVLGGAGSLFACGGATSADPTGCQAWQPSAGAWSSLATGRPASMSSFSLSASGKQFYGVGNWLEAGMVRSGLFRSSDFGMSWCVFPNVGRITTVTASPADDAYVYGTRISDDQSVTELLRSRDGGATWSVLGLPAVNGAELHPSKSNPDLLELGTVSAPWLSRDGGATWDEIAVPPTLRDSTSLFVTFEPNDPARIALWAFVDGQHAVVFVTSDGGNSWQESMPPVASAGGFVDGLGVGPAGTLFAWVSSRLAASSDWGQTWAERSSLPAGAIPFYGSVPMDAFYVASTSELWRSKDEGLSFEPIPEPKEFESFIAGGPNDTIIGQVPGSFVVTTDAGRSWATGPMVPAPARLVQSPITPWPIWSTGPAAFSTDGGLSWSRSDSAVLLADGGAARAAFHFMAGSELLHTVDGTTWKSFSTPPGAANIHGLATCNAPRNCIFVMYDRGASALASDIARSTDGGRTWQASFPLPDGQFYLPDVMAVSPDDPEHLLVSGGPGLMETRDAGRTWTALDLPNLKRAGSLAWLSGGMAMVASNNLGVPRDVVFRTTDDGASWTQLELDAGGLFASYAHPHTVFLVNGSVLRSDDSGATWSTVAPPTGLTLSSIADAPNGKFIASETNLGLVQFE